MNRILFGPGARGDLILRIQHALAGKGSPPKFFDGIYGDDTKRTVLDFQARRGLDQTGIVDVDVWSALTGEQVPAIHTRTLQLTAAFEGHDYTKAVGDFDGAWLTWGIIGFTLRHGEVQKIILSVEQSKPELIDAAFGRSAEELRRVMKAPAVEQRAWAQANSTAGGALADPWRPAFAAFGSFPEVRELQRKNAFEHYFEPARATATRFGLVSELGLALAFDIHVQNGGIGAEAAEQIRQGTAALPGVEEGRIREIIANAVADHSKPEFREDVRSRKLAIARGAGSVHQTFYQLDNWGLAELAADSS